MNSLFGPKQIEFARVAALAHHGYLPDNCHEDSYLPEVTIVLTAALNALDRDELIERLARLMRNGHDDDGSELDSAVWMDAERYLIDIGLISEVSLITD
jgi:hypothetical protein